MYVQRGFHFIMTLSKRKHLTPRVTLNRPENRVNKGVRKMTLKKTKNQKPRQELKYHLAFKKVIKPPVVDIFSYCCSCCYCPTLKFSIKKKDKSMERVIDTKRKPANQGTTRNPKHIQEKKDSRSKKIGDRFPKQMNKSYDGWVGYVLEKTNSLSQATTTTGTSQALRLSFD